MHRRHKVIGTVLSGCLLTACGSSPIETQTRWLESMRSNAPFVILSAVSDCSRESGLSVTQRTQVEPLLEEEVRTCLVTSLNEFSQQKNVILDKDGIRQNIY